MVNRKLGRTSAHRSALFRNQLASLIDKERIITTLPKAKELRPQIERLVTLGKNDSVHARRQAARVVPDEGLIAKLFTTLGPRFAERPGGYTRIIKLGVRRGDAAEMAILEFVGYELVKETPAEKKAAAAAEEKASKKKAKEKESAGEEEKPAKKKTAAPKKEKAAKAPKPSTAKKGKSQRPAGQKKGQ
jgi:large subunit ribosomal protein L17